MMLNYLLKVVAGISAESPILFLELQTYVCAVFPF